jgi:acyl carrier protein
LPLRVVAITPRVVRVILGRVSDDSSQNTGEAGRSKLTAAAEKRWPGHHPEGRTVSVEPRVIAIVSDHFAYDKEKIKRSTTFIEDIGADSLDIVEFVMELEEEFDIQIPDDQAEKIKTVGEAIDYIDKAIGEKGQQG